MLYPVDFAMNNSVADTDFYMKFFNLPYRLCSSLIVMCFCLFLQATQLGESYCHFSIFTLKLLSEAKITFLIRRLLQRKIRCSTMGLS